jgi:hypothetical protein
MEYFAGLDVSLRSCAICVVDAKGKVPDNSDTSRLHSRQDAPTDQDHRSLQILK